MTESMLNDRLADVQRRIHAAAQKVGRDPREITLIGVTKFLPADWVAEGVRAGLTQLGENRYQETPAKQEQLRELLGCEIVDRLTWHFIGHLQTNKVRQVLETFSLIHSLDREKVIDRTDRIAGELGIDAHGLIQVNVSGAESQGGVEPEDLAAICRVASNRHHLQIHGLMAIGPLTEDQSQIREAFRRIRILASEIAEMHLPGVSMEMLSMGMSGDFELAIEEGATHVRVGTAIFGPRRT